MRKLKAWFKPYEWYRKEYQNYCNGSLYILSGAVLVLILYGLSINFDQDRVRLAMTYFVMIMGICLGSFYTLRLVDQHEKGKAVGIKSSVLGLFRNMPEEEFESVVKSYMEYKLHIITKDDLDNKFGTIKTHVEVK